MGMVGQQRMKPHSQHWRPRRATGVSRATAGCGCFEAGLAQGGRWIRAGEVTGRRKNRAVWKTKKKQRTRGHFCCKLRTLQRRLTEGCWDDALVAWRVCVTTRSMRVCLFVGNTFKTPMTPSPPHVASPGLSPLGRWLAAGPHLGWATCHINPPATPTPTPTHLSS